MRLTNLIFPLFFAWFTVATTEWTTTEEPITEPGTTVEPAPPTVPDYEKVEAGDILVLEGIVYKSGKVMYLKEVCADPHNTDCSELSRTLCTTIQSALEAFPELKGLFGVCSFHRNNGENFVTSLTVNDKYPNITSVGLVERALKRSKNFAPPTYAYYDEGVTVASHPVRHGDEVLIEGKVFKNDKLIHLEEECADRHSVDCYELSRTLCTTIQAALNSYPQLVGLFGQCAQWKDKGDHLISTLTVHVNYDSMAPVSLIQEALMKSKQFASVNSAYYGEDVTVTPFPVMAGDRLVVAGKVLKNGELMHVETACADRHSAECHELTRTLCTNMETALEAYPQLRGLFGQCELWNDFNKALIAQIRVDGSYQQMAPAALVQEALRKSSQYADPFTAHYDDRVRVTLQKPSPGDSHPEANEDASNVPAPLENFNLQGNTRSTGSHKWNVLNYVFAAVAALMIRPMQ